METIEMVKDGVVETVAPLEEAFFLADGWTRHYVEGATLIAIDEEAPVEAHE